MPETIVNFISGLDGQIFLAFKTAFNDFPQYICEKNREVEKINITSLTLNLMD